MTDPKSKNFGATLDLIADIYEAAMDPSKWTGFLEHFSQAVHAETAVIWMHDHSDDAAYMNSTPISFAASVGLTEGFGNSYAEHYTYTNPWTKRSEALPEGLVAVSDTYFPDRALGGTEFYADWLRPQGLRYGIGGTVLRRERADVMCTALRLEDRGAFHPDEVALQQTLMPHLKRAIGLHQRIARLAGEHQHLLSIFDRLATPIWVLDEHGALAYMNRAGRQFNQQRDGLWIGKEGMPKCLAAKDEASVLESIRQALASANGSSPSVAQPLKVHRSGLLAPIFVILYPIPRGKLGNGPAAAMFINDPTFVALPAPGTLRTLFGLTAAEEQVALQIAAGARVADTARQLRVTTNTVRTHLKRALSKTASRNQSDLVRTVINLGQAGLQTNLAR